MEYAQKLLQIEAEKILSLIPEKIPEASKRFMNPLANSLKLTTRMLQDFPKSDLKGLDWIFGILGGMVPGLINGLTEDQLRGAAYKSIEIGLAIIEALPQEGGGSLDEC